MIKITRCPSCGSEKIKKVRRNWTGRYQGHTYTVPRLEFYDCPVCKEKVYSRESIQKIEAHSPAFAAAHQERKSA